MPRSLSRILPGENGRPANHIMPWIKSFNF
jgi:hypothetical protein